MADHVKQFIHEESHAGDSGGCFSASHAIVIVSRTKSVLEINYILCIGSATT